jgi:hypothetical protein
MRLKSFRPEVDSYGVDIGGIVDHPSLFKLPFKYQAIIQKIIQMKYNTKTTTKLTKALKPIKKMKSSLPPVKV